MEGPLFGIKNIDSYLVIGVLVLFAIIEIASGFLKKSNRSSSDWIQEAGSFLILSQIIKPLIVLAILFLGSNLTPNYSSILKPYSLWAVLPFYLLIDDLMQYWYHRTAHERPFLWKLHRSHHQAEEMGFLVSYRNAALYYWMMPNIWWVGLITFLGGGQAVALGLILKQIVIIGSHSTVKWDKPFYRLPLLKPIIFIIERVLITPAFHHAHHGRSKLDEVSDPNGNFGNMFSLWDQLFGTALFTRQYPNEYGLQNPTHDHWSSSYFFPLIKSKDQTSEISEKHVKHSTAISEPVQKELKKGENYLWCQCGLSKSQPFCDGSHHGTKFKPVFFKATRDGNMKLCNCKLTKAAPFCDNSHLTKSD